MRKRIDSTWVKLAWLSLCLAGCSPNTTQVVLTQQPTHEVLFPVWGETLREVGAGVHGHLHGGYAGYTRWHMGYTTDMHESLMGTCTVKKIAVNFQSKVTLPHWQSNSAFIHPSVQPTWDRFIAALRAHEQGHADIALTQAQALVAQLQAMSPIQGHSCDALLSIVRQRFDKAVSAAATATERYDVATQHGVTQGARPHWFD
jgi:predicted secreted Zn-dependent protease